MVLDDQEDPNGEEFDPNAEDDDDEDLFNLRNENEAMTFN